ncbi:Bug family tripartite tricarboxylate transporter substrate binding protein [Ramlibacter algicola]|uniref:Tripartite tricarboxylate transporter substrate binding protein n=1 Tax=Ramlibacter algicola TaxID=2795217 RepID=A0A934Q1Q4_9BURK|nr:tripartite tricarboxylate transporter substrate binding protein [Ramlibacter algicola]MBK0393286.1 tripartite tricarboxylate transporter substrate binding protein [Ramlibacter algicola]
MRRKTFIALACAGAAAAVLPAHAQQAYPNKPIRIVVPFAVAGIADSFARAIALKLGDAWGQPVVVENKTGAGGNIGADLVAKSPPDGYTLVMGNIGTHAVNPFLVKNMPFDPIKDFTPIAHVLDAEGLLVVNPSVPAKNVAELVAYSKAQSGKLSYASGGLGTTSHLAGELFKSLAKVSVIHVPYKGNSPAILDVIGGQATMAFATMPTVLPHVKAGKLRALAVLGSARTRALPDLPPVADTLAGFDVSNWIGLFAPAGTPAEVVNKINAEVQKIMQTPEMQKRMEAEGAKFIPTTPQTFAAFQKAEADKWGKTIRDAGISPE